MGCGPPRRIQNALLPDGTRGTAENLGLLLRRKESAWMRTDGQGGWIFGDVELGNEAVFTDAVPQPRPGPVVCSDDGKSDREAYLAESPEVLAAIQDDDFAQTLSEVR